MHPDKEKLTWGKWTWLDTAYVWRFPLAFLAAVIVTTLAVSL